MTTPNVLIFGDSGKTMAVASQLRLMDEMNQKAMTIMEDPAVRAKERVIVFDSMDGLDTAKEMRRIKQREAARAGQNHA